MKNNKFSHMKNISIKELQELHYSIKTHPWRSTFDQKYVNDYCNKYKKLLEGAYNITKKMSKKSKKGNKFYRAVFLMYHDAVGGIGRLGSAYVENNKLCFRRKYKFEDQTFEFLELCLSVLHKIVYDEDIDVCWTYYTGDWILEGIPRLKKHVWYDEKQSFIPDYTIEQWECLIDYWSKHPDIYEETLKWGKEMFEFIKSKKEKQ